MTPERAEALRRRQGWELSHDEWVELALAGQLTPAQLVWRSTLAEVEFDLEEEPLVLKYGGRRLGLNELSMYGKVMLANKLRAGDYLSFEERLRLSLFRQDLLTGKNLDLSELPATPPPERGFTLSTDFYDFDSSNDGGGKRDWSRHTFL